MKQDAFYSYMMTSNITISIKGTTSRLNGTHIVSCSRGDTDVLRKHLTINITLK